MLRIPESSSGQAVRRRNGTTAFRVRSKPILGLAVHNLRNMNEVTSYANCDPKIREDRFLNLSDFHFNNRQSVKIGIFFAFIRMFFTNI